MYLKDLSINIGEADIGFFDLSEINEGLKIVHDSYNTSAMNEFSEAYHQGRKAMLLDIITYFNIILWDRHE